MTQLNNVQPDNIMQLRDMLRLIAQSAQIEDVAPVVLREACHLTNGQAAFYAILGESDLIFAHNLPIESVPDPVYLISAWDDWDDVTNRWLTDVHLPETLTAYVNWLLIPVQLGDKLLGAMGILFSDGIDISDAQAESVDALVDAAKVATNNAIATMRHNKLMQNQTEFVRIVSHDLRSPLTSIKGFASMLESQMVGELNEKQAHFVEKILSGIAQMTSLVDNIQDAGRYDPETGFYEMERAPADVIEIVHKIVNNHLLPAEKQELTLTMSTADDIPIINVDADMIERSIANLVDNAIKYTPNGGQIEVSATREGQRVVISVTDTGYGISEENLRNLFQRHFRIRRREHNRVKGSGLGLFIVRSVAQQHGGDAFVSSKDGEGSTFGIYIPLVGNNLVGK